jgi:Acetyltransferase (GNAT) domain
VSAGWLDLDGYREAWAAAGGSDPFGRPEYLAAAALIDPATPAAFAHDGVLYPFLVRPLAGGRCDITSAYGYGGPYGRGDWRDAFAAACRERGVVSEFVRFHPLLANQQQAGGDLRSWLLHDVITVDTTLDDDGLVAQMAPAARNKLRKAMRAGVQVRRSGDLDAFHELYTESMQRLGAREFYFFSREFFHALSALDDDLVLLDAGVAAGLFLCGGGAMHYYLSAAAPAARDVAAVNLLLFCAMQLARERGLTTLSLGGGLRDGDPLHRFKESLGAGRAACWLGSAVHDQAAYERLCTAAGAPPDDPFFPAYRRPASAS